MPLFFLGTIAVVMVIDAEASFFSRSRRGNLFSWVPAQALVSTFRSLPPPASSCIFLKRQDASSTLWDGGGIG